MNLELLLQGILPLIVFAVVDLFASMRTAILAAIAMGIVEACWGYYRFGEVDQITWVSIALLIVMGLVSIKMKSDRLFKFQPVVLGVIMGSTMLWFQWLKDPLLVQMLPKVAVLLPEDRKWMTTDPRMIERFTQLDFYMAWAFFAHATLIAWAALRKSTKVWLVCRAVGFYVFAGLALLANMVLVR